MRAVTPRVARGSRPTDHSADADYVTSFETYLRCELYTYSERTLRAYLSHAEELARRGGKHDDSEPGIYGKAVWFFFSAGNGRA